jgi:hypothetical protein
MQEVVKLAQAGVNKDVLVAFVNNSAASYQPSAEEIIYLNDLGVPDEVITAILKKAPVAPGPAYPPPPSPAPQNPQPSQPPPNATPAVANAPATPEASPVPAPSITPPRPAVGLDPPPKPVAPAQPPAEAVSPTFYKALQPYGAWVNLPDYGWSWQPAVAVSNPAWRPYGDNGQWLYTDSGWYWHSDYSWGWAPFHYGRWHRHSRYGWVWEPDNVWGPSWVSWRYAEGYCGWAPLPPAARFEAGVGLVYNGARVDAGFDFGLDDSFYMFVPAGHFCDPYPVRFALGFGDAGAIFRGSSVLNHYGFRGGVWYNEGFGRDRIAVAARVDIPLARIQESRSLIRPVATRGGVISVYRPRVEARGRFHHR